MERYPDFTIKIPGAASVNRLADLNQLQVEKSSHAYKETFDATQTYGVNKIRHLDETGVNNVHNPVNIVATK